MDTSAILAMLRAERDQIDFAIAALEALGGDTSAVKSVPKVAQVKTTPGAKKRVLSAASRKKMSEAAKERWAQRKRKTAKPAASAKKPASKNTASKKSKRVVSAQSRKKMAAAQRKRWAAKKAASEAPKT